MSYKTERTDEQEEMCVESWILWKVGKCGNEKLESLQGGKLWEPKT